MTVSTGADLTTRYLGDQPNGAAGVAGGNDEVVGRDGSPVPHWSPLLERYRRMGDAEFLRRASEIELLLDQEGVRYTPATGPIGTATAGGTDAPADAEGSAGELPRPRPWALDPLPMLVAEPEWRTLERGLQQRAELLDAIVADLYGERRLLRDRLVPPEMILGDPQYLRPWHGVVTAGHRQLALTACDVHRGSDGAWRVLSHRTQAPSGLAYALENRRVLARVFPAVFRSARARRLGPFLQVYRAAIEAAAPPGTDDPTVVVLSPGALSETAFEHASLATRLGYPLVEGSDLRVRDGRVWLKTVSDLVPVHVILRRVDATFCDPLELRPDSTLGVPGLVDACRTGAVSILNPLGAGVLENAGLLPILPSLARAMLGTDLTLPGVQAWWCADDAARSHVLANLGSLVVRPLSRATLGHSIDTTGLSRDQLDGLAARIEAEPAGWVGQERVEPSTSPVLSGGRLEPRATMLRTFAVASEAGYAVLPGGLARTAGDDGGPIANRAGAIAKDVWVLGPDDGPREVTPIRIAGAEAAVGSTAARAAENLFWLGRYAERAEATVRLLRAIEQRRSDVHTDGAGAEAAALRSLLAAATRITGTWPGFVGDDAEAALADPDRELSALVVDRWRPGTVANAVERMFSAMGEVRDQLSVDTWLVVGSLKRLVEAHRGDDPIVSTMAAVGSDDRGVAPTDDRDATIIGLLDQLLHGLLSLSGLATESMVRDQGWHFMDAGRRIERSLHVAALAGEVLGREHPPAVETLLVESVAAATESIVTHRRRQRGRSGLVALLDLVLTDAGNPRSLRFQVDRLADDLAFLRAARPSGSALSATPLVLDVSRLVQDVAVDDLAEVSAARRPSLVELSGSVRDLLARASDGIERDFFVRLLPQRSVQTPIEPPERLS
ncbi:MAG: circularly permuted type 2 ATP-grasp protein [Actinomycetota bacterium]